MLGRLLKFVGLVVAAGATGIALGTALTELSADDQRPPATDASVPGLIRTPTSAASERPRTTATLATSERAFEPAKRVPAAPTDAIRVRVFDAVLFTDAAASGRREQRARMTVRLRTENTGDRRVTLRYPTLRVGSVSIERDPGPEMRRPTFATLGEDESQTVTLRFALAGEVTPKAVRDRRARINIAGQSIPIRVRVRAPSQ